GSTAERPTSLGIGLPGPSGRPEEAPGGTDRRVGADQRGAGIEPVSQALPCEPPFPRGAGERGLARALPEAAARRVDGKAEGLARTGVGGLPCRVARVAPRRYAAD